MPPDAPAPAAPPAAAATPPAAAPPPTTATPPAPPAPKPTGAQRKVLGSSPRNFTTRPANHAIPPATVASEPAAPGAPGQASGPATAAEPNRPSNDPAAVAGQAPADAKPGDKPEAKPALDAAEESRRIARIRSAESKLEQQRREFAAQQTKATTEHGEALNKAKMFDQLRGLLEQNPLEFLNRMGIPQQRIIDAMIGESAKPEAQRAQEKNARENAEVSTKLAQLEKELQTARETSQREAAARSAEQYKSSAIAPVLADKAKYELTLRALGDKAADEVFALQQRRFQVTSDEVRRGLRREPVILSPSAAADMFESHFRSQRDLLVGKSASPAKQEITERHEPPADQTTGSQTQKPTARGVFRPAAKAYSIRNAR